MTTHETSHFRKVCKHGTLVMQCRCIGPRVDIIVPCPSHCKEREDTAR